jgi:hypothetical protein
MQLYLYTAPLRARHRAESIHTAVEVPDALAAEYLVAGIACRAPSGPATAAPAVAESDAVTEPRPAAARWPHKMSPEQYLHRFPTGPDADLARAAQGEA